MAQSILNDSSQKEQHINGPVPGQGPAGPQPGEFLLRSKKRADNYSRKDKQQLIELVTSRLDILENKLANTGVNLQKSHCWMEIANEYNRGRTATSDYWRDDRQLKDLWKRMKFTARADLIRYAKQKEKNNSTRNNKNTNKDDATNNGLLTNEILDDFTVILLRLVPAHFQMDTEGKVLQVIDELLALSPDEVEKQKVLSRSRRQQRRQQLTGQHHDGNPDEDDDDDDDACVLLEVSNSPPDNEPVMILDNCLPPPQCPTSNNSRTSATGTPVASSSNERLINNSPQETNYYTDTVVINPQQSSTTVQPGGHRTQLIDIDRGIIENSQHQRQPQTLSQSLLPPHTSAPPNQLLPQPSHIEQQQAILQEEPMFSFKSENDIDEAARQSWYIEQIGSRNQLQYDDAVVNEPAPAEPEKDYQYRRKRKTPFYRTLLEDDHSEGSRQQLIEMARKENEKELQLLDIQTQCEKQRLVREKMETENAVLKQRLLLQMLQSQINKGQGLPSISLLL